jgi:tRNA(fMet)-specific endonuclease VapC
MAFLLDTNILSHLVRDPRGRISDRIKEVKEQNICTSVVVAAELRCGAAKKASPRLTNQLDSILHAIDVLAFERPADTVYGELRAKLERAGQSICANDLLVAAHAVALGHTVVTDNERNFRGSRIYASKTGYAEVWHPCLIAREGVSMTFPSAPVCRDRACFQRRPKVAA